MTTKFTILITRPSHQAQPLCNAICANGGEPILFPTIEIAEPENKFSLLNTLKELNNFDLAIFTSSNAVLKTMPYWPKIKPTRLQIVANGPATAKALEQFALTVNLLPPSPFTSETLLEMPQLQQVKHKKIVVFTGADGRGLLTTTLRERGAEVVEAISYRRIQPQTDATPILEKLPIIDFILVTSYDSLKNLLNMLLEKKPLLLQTKIIVVSDRLAIHAKELGFKNILIAENATDGAIIELIKK